MTTEYEAITEDEWKSLATTEITHLTDEEKDYLPAAWDEWIARVRRDAAREALDGLIAWHRAQIIRARRDDDHDSMRWARMDSGRWVCLDGESAGIECEPVDLSDVTVIVGAEQ